MEKNTNSVKKPWEKSTIKIAVGFLLAAGIGLGVFSYRTNYAVDSIIYLNENSQNSDMEIEIKVNHKEKVLEVYAKDPISKEIIGEKNFRGSNLDVTVNALVASMLQNASFRENKDNMIVRVENKNLAKGQKLQDELTSEVNGLLQVDLLNNTLIKQTAQTEEELAQLADAYGITLEKAQMIQKIREQSTEYTFEDLAARPIQELQLLQGKETEPDPAAMPTSSETVGGSGENQDIGEEKAKSIAFSHASVQEDMITQSYIKLDYENGIRVYEIEFYAGGYEYDYEIHALTGEIVSQKKEKENDRLLQTNPGETSNNPQITGNSETIGTYIAEADAKTTAFTHAGVSADMVFLEKCKLDYENGIMVYDIEFQSGGYEYEYEINATTGGIVSHKKEIENHNVISANQNNGVGNQSNNDIGNNTGSDIGEEQAKIAAFTHAGVSSDQVWLEKCKQDYEDGILVYDIEFYSDGYEYDYEIDARTGRVIQFKKEVDDNHHNSTTFTNQNNANGVTSYISESEAREIAISRAGLKGVNGPVVEIKLEEEDGIMVYEVEIVSGGYEHKCEIHAVTGEILSYEREKDD